MFNLYCQNNVTKALVTIPKEASKHLDIRPSPSTYLQ